MKAHPWGSDMTPWSLIYRVQTAIIVTGHIVATLMAHRIALAHSDDRRKARDQRDPPRGAHGGLYAVRPVAPVHPANRMSGTYLDSPSRSWHEFGTMLSD